MGKRAGSGKHTSSRRARLVGERVGASHALKTGEILGAIDVGSNAVRLKLARLLDDGSFEQVHQERDPVRPGEGVWEAGGIAPAVLDRLVRVLREYADICRKKGAGHVRAVATSALREANNRDAVIEQVRDEAGVELEVVSGREEARLICLGVLRGMPPTSNSLLIDIGGGSTEVARAVGEEPVELWSIPLGAVRLTSMFDTGGRVARERLVSLRRYAQRVVAEALSSPPRRGDRGKGRANRDALGSSGTVRAVVSFAARPGTAHATKEDLSRAVEELVRLGPEGRRKRFDAARAEILVAGAAILEAVAHHLDLRSITAIDGGLKEGILVDLVRRSQERSHDPLLTEAIVASGRRFTFDEAHGVHTRDVALALYDQLAPLHRLPNDARLLLEVAAALHDVGHVVARARHHKHSMYLIEHMDLPGLSEREVFLAALVARFHRRSPPTVRHPALAGLDDVELDLVRKLATLLRLADAADRGRTQPVARVDATIGRRKVVVALHARPKARIDIAELDGERALFSAVLHRSLELEVVV